MRFKFSIIFILLLLPIVSAVEVDMKSNFSQGETFLAKVSGNFFETISQGDLVFKRDHVKLPVVPFVKRIDKDYYIYAQLYGKQPGNYSITIENLKYYKVNEIIEEDRIINFAITENFSDFFIEPGFISTATDFSIELQNLNNDEITVLYKTSNESTESGGFFGSLFGGSTDETLTPVILKSGEKKTINFKVSDFNKGLNNLELNTENTIYQIPVFIFEKSEEIPTVEFISGFGFELSNLNLSLSTDSDLTKIIYLLNKGESKVENISLSFSDVLAPHIQIIPNETFDLEKNSSKKIEIIFTSDNEEKVLEGQIQAISGDLFSNIAITLNFLQSFVSTDEDGRVPSCSEINGNLCSEGQTCDEDPEATSDGNCCLGTCKEVVQRSSSGKIIGWILLVLVIGYGVWFYFKKFKKVKNVSDILKLATNKK